MNAMLNLAWAVCTFAQGRLLTENPKPFYVVCTSGHRRLCSDLFHD